jgi:hypothetical protein
MGLLDLFSKDKRDERARRNNIARAADKNAQSPDRLRALEALANDGSDEALYGLLRRFAINYHKTIEDEQEKDWVFEVLVDKGKAALPAVRRYLRTADSISWPLRLLEKIGEPDEILAALKEVIETSPPGYERDPTRKIQLVGNLGHFEHPEAPALIAPYLEDMDEGVRFAAVEALVLQKREDVARAPLLKLFASDQEESRRLRLKICDGFVECGWKVEAGERAGVDKHLPETFLLDKEGKFKKKAAG